MEVPRFVYGTAWKEERTADLVRAALHAGFRSFDTANQRKHYVEAAVGEGLRHFAGAREELWIQTKYTFQSGQDHRLPYEATAPIAEQVRQSVALSKVHLGVDWLDSLLLHGPATSVGLTGADLDAWRAMQQLLDAGEVRAIGVSNVSAAQLRAFAERGPVTYVQNRCYAARDWDADVREVCAEHSIHYQGFSLLTANRSVWSSSVVAAVAREHGMTPASVLFVAARSLGILPLTGTSNPAHMSADLESLSMRLPDDVIKRVLALS